MGSRALSLETLLRRDRFIVGAALAATTILAWGYMVGEARAMERTGVCCAAGMKMAGPDMQAWSATTLVPLFLMWAEMMVAMMIPSAAPMILTFASVNRKRRQEARPYVPTGIFLLGYLASWTAFSSVAAMAQWGLHATALLSPRMVSTSPIFGGGLLIAAGLFQWTPLKLACLRHCRSPLAFLMTGWREGAFGAFVMGWKQGVYCTGCCWFLMALLFVAGVMNIIWVGIISAFVLLEKVAPKGARIAGIAGFFLCSWGVCLLARLW